MQSGYREHNFFAISIPFISGISISKNTISGITDDESKENAVLKVKILIVSIFLSEKYSFRYSDNCLVTKQSSSHKNIFIRKSHQFIIILLL